MLIQGSKTSASSSTLVCGLFDMYPVKVGKDFLINPTQQQLDEAGIDAKERTKHKFEINESYPVGYTAFDIWLKYNHNGEEFHIPLTFRITEQEVSSRNSGKTQFVNNRLQTTWGFSPEDIADANAARESSWSKFDLSANLDPRPLRDDELSIMHFLCALGRYKPSQDDFLFEKLSDKVWKDMVDELDYSYLNDILNFLEKDASANNVPFAVRMAVGVDTEKRRMTLYRKYSYAPNGVNDLTPFLYAGQTVQLGDSFALRIRDIDRKIYRENPDALPGQYAWTNRNMFNFRPQTVVLELPDLTQIGAGPIEEPYAPSHVDYDNV